MTMPVMAQSLEQAVAETLASNPEIKSAFNEFMSRNSMIDVAKGDYLPSVDLRAGVGYNNYDNEFGTKGEYDPKQAEISIRQLLWDGSITWNNINRNQSETEAQRYQLLSDAQDKALKTAEVYLDVLRAEAVLKLSESNYKVHQHMYVDIKKRADAGIGSTADLAQVEGRLARSKTNLLAAQSNLNDKKTEFARTVGTFPDSLVTPEVDANFIPNSLDDAIKIAKKNNPVMYVASNDIDAAEYQYKQAKGNFYPTFDIEASQEWGNELNGSR
ncbi:TolC family protein, partial [Psychrobacter sp. Ps6]|nr:TolC family protein [Psychrobacter sp. Ps6]